MADDELDLEENTVGRVDPDVVMSPSVRADGTPDQTPGFEVIEPDTEPEPAETTPKRRSRRKNVETTAER